MARRGAAKGTGKGYRNLARFPNDPKIHRDSARGRKQPQRIASQVRQRTGLPETSISRDNWGIEIKPNGKMDLRLGNTTTAGWYWTGDQDDLVGFFTRLNSSEVTEQFINTMKSKGIEFKDMKPYIMKSAEKGDGLYEISGDNRVWHFGENLPDDEEGEFFESMLQDDGIENTDDLYDKFTELIEYPSYDFDDFADKDRIKSYKQEMKDLIETSNSYKEFGEKIDDARDGWREEVWSWQQGQLDTALAEAYGKLKKEIGTKNIYSVVEKNGKRLAVGEFKSFEEAKKFVGKKKKLEVKEYEIIPQQYKIPSKMK